MSKVRSRENKITQAAIRRFRKVVYDRYRQHGRDLPWRGTRNPYRILISEIMLQQTQVERVLEKYETFIKAFPDFPSLARAPLRKVLRVWQGLGYNRRAKALKETAERVVAEFDGKLPVCEETLLSFPGIGKATAAAIATFAFDDPTVFIETNIRRVFLHFFFRDRDNVHDAEILPLVEKTLDRANPREWYYALMDFGVMLKKEYQNPNRRSAHYHKQAPFEGSDRQIRGLILRMLVAQGSLSGRDIVERVGKESKRVKRSLRKLQEEGLVKEDGERYRIT